MPLFIQRANRFLLLSLIAALYLAFFIGTASIQAAGVKTITVCSTGCDFESIQGAIDDPGTVSGDVIEIKDAVHTEGGIIVPKSVIIQGQGAHNTVVQAAQSLDEASERVFLIVIDTAVTIRQMTIRYGHPSSDPWAGGGIRNEGDLTLEDCVISDNIGSAGGGIWSDGTLTLISSTVRNNKTMGGITHIECNGGGGIKGLSGVITLVNSTVSDNIALGKGAGFHIACQSTLVLINSTISGNQTTYDGGGIYLNGVGEFTNSTIVRNSAKTGGGVYANGSKEEGVEYGLLNYTNTIIADNTITFEKYGTADCMIGEDASVGININNLVEDGSCGAAFSGDPALGPLEDNGGKTQSHAPSADSLVIDAIPAGECVVDTDQWGMPRPFGAGCDIGAVELQESNRNNIGYWLLGILIVLLGYIGFVVFRRRRQAV